MLKLRLLATSDLHVHVLPYDYYRDRVDDTLGFARTASLIREARAQARNCLLLDCGDLIQGSPMGDFVAERQAFGAGATHPMIAAMNAVGYDCGTLGNHDFNYGIEFLIGAMSGADHPVVCGNVTKVDGAPLLSPWAILERRAFDETGREYSLKIGVVGFVPPQIMQWDKALLTGRVLASDIVDAARKQVPELRGAGADIVIALCHSGIAAGERRGGEENAALHLAALDGIDALVLGHQHLVFPGAREFAAIAGVDAQRGALWGKPAVMAGAWGGQLGIIDLELETSDDGGWSVTNFKVEVRATEEGQACLEASDAAVVAAVADCHAATLAHVREPVGWTSEPLHSYFSLVGEDAASRLVGDAQAWYVEALLRDGPHEALPLLSAVAPFKAGGRAGPSHYTDIQAGPLAIKDIADLYVFPNTVRVVRVSGAQLREWLEYSAALYNRIEADDPSEQELVDSRFPSYQCDAILGVTYRIDVARPARYDFGGALVAPASRRVVDLAYGGEPVRDEQHFVVVTNSYRADGGGGVPGAGSAELVLAAPDLTRDVVMRYVKTHRRVAPRARGDWSLVLPQGANVVFSTGPGAAGHEPAGVAVERLGPGSGGFVRYRLGRAARLARDADSGPGA